MTLNHKKLAAKYWDMLHPHVNFYALKEIQIQNQYVTMEKFLKLLEGMKNNHDKSGGFYDKNEKLVIAGDHVLYLVDGRKATLINALQDGDADVRFDDGKYGLVKWNNLRKI